MKAEIASLQNRMAQGGDWKAFCDEIASLHREARTEDEFVALLEAHANLVAVGKHTFDEDTYVKVLELAACEYQLFLIREATDGERLSPAFLDRITRREVAAGRLSPDDDFRKLAAAAGSVLSDSYEPKAALWKPGDWFFYGAGSAVLAAVALAYVGFSPIWVFPVGLLVGWLLNARERPQVSHSNPEPSKNDA